MNKLLILLCLIWAQTAFAKSTELKGYNNPPKGWKTEIINFPFDFAPDIPLQGSEELIFAPGMYKPEQESYFSYAFAWLVQSKDTQPLLSITEVKSYLHQYYVGLHKAVAKKDHADVTINMQALQHGKWRYDGTIKWIEPFISQQPQTLYFKATVNTCAKKGEQRWYFIVSPQQATHDIWSQLNDLSIAKC